MPINYTMIVTFQCILQAAYMQNVHCWSGVLLPFLRTKEHIRHHCWAISHSCMLDHSCINANLHQVI